MKFMRERLFELVAGLSLRRAASVTTPEPPPTQTAASTRPRRYPRMKQNVSTSAYMKEDANDESTVSRPEPLKLRKKPKRRALG